MPRGEQFHRLELPALLAELLQRLPDSIRTAHLATRIVQQWRVPKNPISNVRSDDKEDFGFLIAAPFAEKVTHKVAQLIREGKKFAVLIAVDLLPQIKVTKTKEDDRVGAAMLAEHGPAHHSHRTPCSGMAREPPRLSASETRSCSSLWNPRLCFNGRVKRKWKCRFGCRNDGRVFSHPRILIGRAKTLHQVQ
jgi:hypothetical protein